MQRWVDVAYPEEIADQTCKLLEIDRKAIAVFNLGGAYYAIEDNCPHQHLPIADGIIEDCTITCPYHGAKFNLTTGELLAPPACDNLTTFPVRIEDGKVQIKI